MPDKRKRRSQLSKKSSDAKRMCISRSQELMEDLSGPQKAGQHIDADVEQSTQSLTQVDLILRSFPVSRITLLNLLYSFI